MVDSFECDALKIVYKSELFRYNDYIKNIEDQEFIIT